MKNRLTLALIVSVVSGMLCACAPFKPMAGTGARQPAAAPANGAAGDASSLPWATIRSAFVSSEGGAISAFSFSEKQGDASIGPLAVRGDMLNVAGQFLAKWGSQWGGVAVMVSSPGYVPVKASDYKLLNIKLASSSTRRLRLRLIGPNEPTQKLGCYPIFVQVVQPEVTEYSIPLERFAPEIYCGTKGIGPKATLTNLTAIEVAEITTPVRDHAVAFSLGAISLAR